MNLPQTTCTFIYWIMTHIVQVHGIDNLRVVDASVFPVNFSSKSGPFLTVHDLAEKAASILYKTCS
jgi:choline dehydrogenase-like flavoprotein